MELYQNVYTKWHHNDSYKQVRYCQRYDKVVGHSLQSPLTAHRQNNEDIAKKRKKWEENEKEGPVVVFDWKEKEQ